MSAKTVAFLDSGVGGMPYLAEVQRRRPDWNFAYVADNGAFPYGDKEPEELCEVVEAVASATVERVKPDALVLACNTASVTALAYVRSRLDLPIVGVVPAVKPAAGRSTVGRIGVLATSRTVADAYLDRLIQDFASDCVVTRVAAGDIVRFVENDLPGAEPRTIDATLRPGVEALREAGVDTVVLGCTHFLHVCDQLSALFGRDIVVVDSRDGVASRVISVVDGSHVADRTADHTAGAAPGSAAGEGVDSRRLFPAANIKRPAPRSAAGRLYVTKSHGADAPIAWFAAKFGLEPAGLL